MFKKEKTRRIRALTKGRQPRCSMSGGKEESNKRESGQRGSGERTGG